MSKNYFKSFSLGMTFFFVMLINFLPLKNMFSQTIVPQNTTQQNQNNQSPNQTSPQISSPLQLDLETPNLPPIIINSILTRGWLARDLYPLSRQREEDTSYQIKGRILNWAPSPTNTYAIICRIETNQWYPQFTSSIEENGSFSGTIYLAKNKAETKIELKISAIDTETGLERNSLGKFTLHIQ